MRLAFFGLPLAAWLLHRDGHEIDLAVLSPVPAPGRRRLARVLGEDRILDAAHRRDADLCGRVDARLEARPPELLVSWYWTRRLPQRWLARATRGGIGAHPSLLPRHRGPDPFFWAIDSGDEVTGVTVHRLTPRYDDGDILLQAAIPIGERDAWQLARALDRPSLDLLRRAVRLLDETSAEIARPQDPAQATWAPEPTGEALRVDWTWPTARVLRRIRALSPVPGLAIEVLGLRLFVTGASAASHYPEALQPGEAAELGDPPSFAVIRTSDGAICLRRAAVPRSGDEPLELDARGIAEAIHRQKTAHALTGKARP